MPDRIAGLEYGDDYLVKPFAMAELIARVRSLCSRIPAGRPPKLNCGDLEIDTGRREVRPRRRPAHLDRQRVRRARTVGAQPGHAGSRGDLIVQCWDRNLESPSNVLDVLIAQLRRKLRQPAVIHTVRGTGYRIDPA